MANFTPLKIYMLMLLDDMIDRHNLKPPFLDVGCGRGDVSLFLARKEWHGMTIDTSYEAYLQAEKDLCRYNNVKVENTSIYEISGQYNTIILWDVLEHEQDDKRMLQKISTLTSSRGWLCLSVPTTRKEWRWDDEFYGHYRRYDKAELKEKLLSCGFKMVEYSDFTFPVFWLMRRLYTRLKKGKVPVSEDKEILTRRSTLHNAWEIGGLEKIVQRLIPWRAVYILNRLFRNLSLGHESLILCQKCE